MLPNTAVSGVMHSGVENMHMGASPHTAAMVASAALVTEGEWSSSTGMHNLFKEPPVDGLCNPGDWISI